MKPVRVTVPSDVGELLSTRGLPVKLLQEQVLSTVRPSLPRSSLMIGGEWERAPSMVMLGLNPAFVANADSSLAAVLGNKLQPLETDYAFCGRTRANHEDSPMPTATSYARTPILNGGDYYRFLSAIRGETPDPVVAASHASEVVVELSRAKAEITQIFLAGGTNPGPLGDGSEGDTMFTLNLTARNLDFGFTASGVPMRVQASDLAVACPGVIGGPTGPCGDIPVRCVNPTVTIGGLTTDAQWVNSFPFGLATLTDLVRDVVARQLTAGLLLHFDNRLGTSLSFTPDGWLTLKSTFAPQCSPVPPPLPPAPPTRGLVQVQTKLGRGELVGEFGNVIPFEVRPELSAAWNGNRNGLPETQSFLARTALKDPSNMFASAIPGTLPRFLPATYELALSAMRHVPKNCFQKPVRMQAIFELGEGGFLEVTGGNKKQATGTCQRA